MELRLLGRTGTFVSELCLGTMTFAREADEATSAKLLDRYLEAGGNFTDTADVYADTRSEELLGRLLRGRRTRWCWRPRATSRPAAASTTAAAAGCT
jgi:aryl-alcohol dehydrogenase-like predicted oxidoreductase